MSGSTIGGVVGAFVGYWFGNPQLGWMIGSAIGGYVDPEQVVGPRLQDATVQTSRVGIPIPFGWGRFPVAGNLLWAGPINEHENTEREGKGGPEVTTFTYTRSYAIGLCQGMLGADDLYDPIAGIVLVKRNGKVVYDARTDAELEEEFNASGGAFELLAAYIAHRRALASKFINRCTFYLGSEDQLPDPTMEGYLGVGEVPAYPGLAYMVVEEDDVTETAGAIPQYEVVVSSGGTATPSCAEGMLAWWPLDDASPGGAAAELVQGINGTYSNNDVALCTVEARPSLNLTGSASTYFQSADMMRALNASALGMDPADSWSVSVWYQVDPTSADVLKILGQGYVDGFSGKHVWGNHLNNSVGSGDFMTPAGGYGNDTEHYVEGTSDVSYGQTYYQVTTYDADTNTLRLYLNRALIDSITPSGNGGSVLFVQAGGVTGNAMVVQDLQVWGRALSATEIANSYLPAGSDEAFPIPDADGLFVLPDGTIVGPACVDALSDNSVLLSTIVAGLCYRAGLTADDFDVSELTDLVEGVRFANVSGADAMLAPLMQGYFFDKSEYDGVLHFPKRGGDVVASIGPDDLAERDGDAIEWTRVQEAELLRKTSVTYLDPAANWATNTQDAERRVSTVEAKGEAVFEMPLCATADTAAQMADKTLKVAWSETEKCKFSLPALMWARLVPANVVALTDKEGEVHRVRLLSVEEDSGVLLVEAVRDRQSSYTSDVEGVRPPAPRDTTPGLIGPTVLAVMDLPVLRDGDDKLGVYVAARGILSGWSGAALYLSTDGGASGGVVANVTRASVIGYTETALVADVSSEYPSGQTLQVWLPSAPSSVSYANLLRYNNRAALQLDSGEWEVLQYQTVTDDGDDLYTLSGVIRGRYATTPGAAAAGATFVLLDSTVQFVEVERWMVGESDMQVKAVSFGTDPDATAYTDFTFTTPASQTEWPPTNVTAVRDGSDNVTVTWAGRPRLGTEVAPYHSQHFTGYRVSYSDGVDTFTYDVLRTTLVTGSGTVATLETSEHTYTAAMQTSDFGSVPASLTVTVSGLNAITGAGTASEEVTA